MTRLDYVQLEDGTLRITGAEEARTILVPQQLDGRDVTEIGSGAFIASPALSSVMLPGSIRRIEEGAFRASPRVVLFAYRDSPAEQYAERNMMPHVVLTTQSEQQIRALMAQIPAEYVCGDYRYTRNDAGEAAVSFYTGKRGGDVLVIPAELDGCRVTGIGRSAFRELQYRRFVLPCGVREIGEAAFDMCFRMESIALPDRLERIGDRAFNRCERLGEICLPESVKHVGREAFRACEALECVRVAGRDTLLGDDVFACRRAKPRLVAAEGSAALQYARRHGMDWAAMDENEGKG